MTKLGVLMGYRHCLKHLSVPGKTKPKKHFLKIQKLRDPLGLWSRYQGPGVGREKRTNVPFQLASVSRALTTPAWTGPPDRPEFLAGSLLKGKV